MKGSISRKYFPSGRLKNDFFDINEFPLFGPALDFPRPECN